VRQLVGRDGHLHVERRIDDIQVITQ